MGHTDALRSLAACNAKISLLQLRAVSMRRLLKRLVRILFPNRIHTRVNISLQKLKLEITQFQVTHCFDVYCVIFYHRDKNQEHVNMIKMFTYKV
jgi:hypothetical protein